MKFKKWTTQEVEEKFKLKRIKNCKSLEAWLHVDGLKMPEKTKLALEKLRDKLDFYGFHWNEDELIWYFVSRFFALIDLESPYYQLFVNRSIEAHVGDYLMKGRVDAIVASGRYDPKAPFYCFHEYKKEKGSADDPIGQLLSAMLFGRKLNQEDKPI